MPFYCGMDLSARDCPVCVIDDKLSSRVQPKGRNALPRSMALIAPFQEPLPIVVESTFNGYWWGDGLQAAGYEVCLAQTLGLSMSTGAKVKTERRDAVALAKLLKAGMLPQASIDPKAPRPIRDLLRQRSRLVARRAAEYGSLRRLLRRPGRLGHCRNDLTETPEAERLRWFAHPLGRLHGPPELQRSALYSQPIDPLEAHLRAPVRERPACHRLLTIPGLGKSLALTLFSELGASGRFPTTRAVAS